MGCAQEVLLRSNNIVQQRFTTVHEVHNRNLLESVPKSTAASITRNPEKIPCLGKSPRSHPQVRHLWHMFLLPYRLCPSQCLSQCAQLIVLLVLLTLLGLLYFFTSLALYIRVRVVSKRHIPTDTHLLVEKVFSLKKFHFLPHHCYREKLGHPILGASILQSGKRTPLDNLPQGGASFYPSRISRFQV